MSKIESNLFNFFKIGDDIPTVLMGVINLSPESFYKSSVYETFEEVREAALKMISSGAHIIDIGARSTAPKSPDITVEEEKSRINFVLDKLLQIIPDNLIISIDTQYTEVAKIAYKIANKFNKKMIINDVSGLNTDPTMMDFITEKNIPIILMASKDQPGDLCTMEEIIEFFKNTITHLKNIGYNQNNIILDPGIGHWVEDKTYEYDLKLISNLQKLRELQRPILIALSRKSFIGEVLDIPDPEDRLMGSLSATAISVYNGAHIIRTHDINKKLKDIIKMAEALRRYK